MTLVCAAVLGGHGAAGQPPQPESEPSAPSAMDEGDRAVEPVDYSGDWRERPAATGDWGGARQHLMDRGVRFDLSYTHVFQGNLAGGVENRIATSGGLDLGLQLDTEQAGLWGGGLAVLKVVGRVGRDHNASTGAFLPVDTNALYPIPEEDTLLISELYYEHALTEWLSLSAGKFSLRDSNVFASDETEQFLNGAFNYNPVQGTTIPLSALGAAVYVSAGDWLSVSTYILDSEGTAERSGFDTLFERGTSILQEFEFSVRPGGLPGHQRIGWTYSDRSRIQFLQNPRDLLAAIIAGNTAGLQRESKDWSVYYDFDQYLWVADEEEDRGIGVFGRLGVANERVNAAAWFASVGIGGRGVWASRPSDSFGAGFYYLGLTDDLPPVVDARARDEWGFEAYYSAAITPWLLVTPDLQVIGPATRSVETTVVAGVRLKAVF
jgi:porin